MSLDEHLLVILIEECNEVAYHTSKALRFGLDDKDPTLPEHTQTERDKIHVELNHVFAVVEILAEREILPVTFLDRKIVAEKKRKVWEFMEYSHRAGTLT